MDFHGWQLTFKSDRMIWRCTGDTRGTPHLIPQKANQIVPAEIHKKWKGFKKRQIIIPYKYVLHIYEGMENHDKADHLGINAVVPCKIGGKKGFHADEYRFVPINEHKVHLPHFVKLLNKSVFGIIDSPIRSFYIIINPKAGKGQGQKVFEHIKPILEAAPCVLLDDKSPPRKCWDSVYTVTSQPGQAKDIAKNLDILHYDSIVCIGGDGTIHEVINGLAEREDSPSALSKFIIATIPAGSGNAMSMSLFGDCDPSYAAFQALRGEFIPIDLMSVVPIDNTKKTLWSFLSVAYGWIAHADIHTEFMRFMGSARFSLGVAAELIFKREYPCSYAIHGELHAPDPNKTEREQRQEVKQKITDYYNNAYDTPPASFSAAQSELRSLTSSALKELVGTKRPVDHWTHTPVQQMYSFYAGKLPWTAKDALAFPAALCNDGYIDLCILKGPNVNIPKMVKIFTKFEGGQHYDSDEVIYTKVKSFKLLPGILHLQQTDHERLHKSVDPNPANPDHINAAAIDVGLPAAPNAANDETTNLASDPPDRTNNYAEKGKDTPNEPGPASPDSSEWVRVGAPPPTRIGPPKPLNPDRKAFKNKFVLSIDGERYDPGHGIICEVQQGLVTFISDFRVRQYLPSNIRRKPPNAPASPAVSSAVTSPAETNATGDTDNENNIINVDNNEDDEPEIGAAQWAQQVFAETRRHEDWRRADDFAMMDMCSQRRRR